jgi:hypothetical protein
MLQLLGDVAAVRGKLDRPGLCSQTFILAESLGFAGIIQVFGELLARGVAAVEIDEFHQSNDRVCQLSLCLCRFGERVEHGGESTVAAGAVGRGRRGANKNNHQREIS